MRSEPDWQRDVNLLQQPRRQSVPWAHVPVPRIAPKRIALVGPSRASLAVTVGSLIHDIAQRGHHIICFAPELGAKAATDALMRLRAEVRNLPAFRQGFSPLADQMTIARLASVFRSVQPDVVASYSPKAALLAGIAGRMAGAQNIVAMIGELGRGFEDAPDRSSRLTRQLQKAMLRLVFGLSHTAVFFNEENHKLLHLLDLLPERLREFPMNGSGIDLARFPHTPLPPLDRGIMFLYAGPLDRRFGIVEFCEARAA
ncbi:MAG: glycosyltransferase family 4 protein [Rhodomicrobium sp.]|nr:glycosyltransferase family 4 protein [Rhodomicrobium sp.]